MIEKIKKLASQTAIYGVFMMLGRFLTFMLTPLYTNYLTEKEMIDVIFLFSVIAFLNIFYSFGMESSFFRFYDKEDKDKGKKAFSMSWFSIFSVALVFTLLITLTSNFTAPYFFDSTNSAMLLSFGFIIPLTDTMHLIPYAYLRITNQAKLFSTLKFVMIIVVVALNLIFVVYYKMGLAGVIYSQLITNVAGVIVFLFIARKNFTIKFDKSLFKEMIRVGLPTLPANLAAMALQLADRPIFKLFPKVEDQLAVYGVNYRLGIPMMLYVTMFEYAWKPYYLNNYKSKDAKRLFSRIFTYFMLIGCLVFMGISFFIEYLVKIPLGDGKFLIAEIYWLGLDIIPIILAAYLLNGAFTNFSAGFLITKKTQFLPVAVISASIVNIAINVLFLPELGFRVAAWATLAAYFVSAMMLYILSRRVYKVNYEWYRVSLVVVITAVLFYASTLFNFEMLYDIYFKIGLLILFFLLMRLFGFFTPGELSTLKNMFRKKN